MYVDDLSAVDAVEVGDGGADGCGDDALGGEVEAHGELSVGVEVVGKGVADAEEGDVDGLHGFLELIIDN